MPFEETAIRHARLARVPAISPVLLGVLGGACLVAACSGSSPSSLLSNPAGVEAGTAATPETPTALDAGPPASDGAPVKPDAPLSVPRAPLIGLGDSPLPDGAATTPTPPDAGDDAADLGDVQAQPPSPMGASDAASTSAPTTCWVTFSVSGALIDGVIVQNVVIGGDAAALGGWDPSMALDMSAVAGAVGVWTIALPLASGSTVHFKFGMSGGGGLTWEAAAQSTDRALFVSCPDGGGVSYAGQYNQIVADGGP
jgi:hypothetical protein